MSWTKSAHRPSRLADPYYDWAVATDFRYYGETAWLPVLLELAEPKATEFAERAFKMRDRGWASLLRIPAVYRSPPKALKRPLRFLTGLAKRDFLAQLYAGDEPSAEIRRFEVGHAVELPQLMRDENGWGTGPALASGIRRGSVVVGVIDDGLAFAHQRFRDGPTSTRIHYFWDQMVPSPVSGSWSYGREIAKHDTAIPGIDTRLAASRHGSLIDEDELYRGAGYLDYSQPGHKAFALRGSHGTHVMDLACNPPAPGIGPVIAVQLPSLITEDTSGAGLAPQVIDALMYMLDRAAKIAAANHLEYLPVVANLSYGMIAGPHDGTGAVEQAIDEILNACNTDPHEPRLRVVVPSGNNFLSRCHAEFSLSPADPPRELRWRVLPDDWTESFLEIWYPGKDDSGGNAMLQITVTAPDGSTTLPFAAGTTYSWQPGAGGTSGLVSFYPAMAGSSRSLIRLSLAPTAWPDGALTLAPAGVWRIAVENVGKGRVEELHAWIQRDDAPFGYPRRGRQSYFEDRRYAVFDNGGRPIENDNHPLTAGSYIRRKSTLNAIATGRRTVVVGGIRRSDWNMAIYSAAGPVVHPPGRGAPSTNGPDASTVSEDSPSHHGVLAAGTRSGSCIALYGTSVAAPQITRWIAGNLVTGGLGDRQAVANFTKTLVAPPVYTERNPPPGAAPQPPVPRGGVGRVEFPSTRPPRRERL